MDVTQELEADPIDLTVTPRIRDLGDGFQVRRALPSPQRQMVGPFIFWDQMGPTLLREGHGLDVRPHPHIGLATVTYLFEGEIVHRDSLGSVQTITPGAVNWMNAGAGIVHSERSPQTARTGGKSVFGIQSWVALPKSLEDSQASFTHYPADALPVVKDQGVELRVLAGKVLGARSPVKTSSELFYADLRQSPRTTVKLTAEHEDRALYLIEGEVEIGGVVHKPGELLIFRPHAEVVLHAHADSRMLLFGGEPLDGPRHIYWNFVASSRDRIEAAKDEWRKGAFAKVPGETEFIPLPDDATPPVRYP